MDKEPPSVADIVAAIRHYLQMHPHAVDTERGIREWWLPGTGPCRPGDVQVALERLVASGAMVEHTLPDGQRTYARPGIVQPRPQGPC